MRHPIVFFLALLFTSALPALETSLILRPPGQQGGDTAVIVQPSTGSVALYRINEQVLEKLSAQNFLADIEYYANYPLPDKPQWSLLRTGLNTTPTYTDYYQQFPLPANKGDKPLAQRALTSDDQFWAQKPTYDGRVNGVMLPNAVVLVIPSTYTLALYTIRNQVLTLAALRNYRSDLYIPQTYNSTPLPSDLLQQLSADAQAQRRQALQKQREELGNQADNAIQVNDSTPWLGISDNNTTMFSLVDAANAQLMTYQILQQSDTSTISVQSVRNLDIDLRITTTYNSTPDISGLVQRYNADLAQHNFDPVTRDYLTVYLENQAVVDDAAGPMHAMIDPSGQLVIDFRQRHRLLVYSTTANGQATKLTSARDYTIEAAIDLHTRELRQRNQGRELLARIKQHHRGNTDLAFQLAATALDWNPWLYKDLERQVHQSFKQDKRWQPLLETAIAEVQRRDELQQALLAEADQRAIARLKRMAEQ